MQRRDIALAALFAAALSLVCASGMPGLVDPDGFSHLGYARLLWKSGFSLRGYPFLPFTVIGQYAVDPWWGFHLFCIPFLPLGDLWGARVAGACIAGLEVAAIAWAISRLGKNAPAWLALAPLAATPFLIRAGTARPGHLTTALVVVQLVAGLGAASPWTAAAAGFAHGLLHLSAPLSPIFSMLGLVSARLAKERGSLRAVLWCVGGLGIALLVRPDRAGILTVGVAHAFMVLGEHLPHSTLEVQEHGLRLLALEAWPLFALLAVACVAGWRRVRAGGRAGMYAALLGAICGCLLAVRALRFLDYAAPCLAILAALLWPQGPLRLRRALAAGCALAFAALLPSRVERVWEIGRRYYDEPASFARIAAAVRRAVPPGSVIFTDDPWVTGILFSALPEYRYLVEHDPSLLWLGSPQLFWRWDHALAEGIDCDSESCAPRPPSGAAIARVLTDFDAQYAVTSMPRGRLSMQEVMARDPSRFDLVELSPGQAYGLYLWRLRPGARMH